MTNEEHDLEQIKLVVQQIDALRQGVRQDMNLDPGQRQQKLGSLERMMITLSESHNKARKVGFGSLSYPQAKHLHDTMAAILEERLREYRRSITQAGTMPAHMIKPIHDLQQTVHRFKELMGTTEKQTPGGWDSLGGQMISNADMLKQWVQVDVRKSMVAMPPVHQFALWACPNCGATANVEARIQPLNCACGISDSGSKRNYVPMLKICGTENGVQPSRCPPSKLDRNNPSEVAKWKNLIHRWFLDQTVGADSKKIDPKIKQAPDDEAVALLVQREKDLEAAIKLLYDEWNVNARQIERLQTSAKRDAHEAKAS